MATISERRQQLGDAVLRRWNQYESDRRRVRKRVQELGIIEAAGARSAARRMSHTTVAEGRSFEALVGGDDTDHVNFLLRGWSAARSVCRLVQGRTAIGTGFLVAPGLLLTNAHVLPSMRDAEAFVAEFDYERDLSDKPRDPRRFALDPQRLFVSSGEELLDFALVAVHPRSERGEDLAVQGWLPLDERKDKILEGEPVVVIQHPLGREKRICLFNSELALRLPGNFLHYTTDTEPGSSGSPAFNRHWQVIALHHASTHTGETHQAKPVVVNEGVRVSAIIAALRSGDGAGQPLEEGSAGDREEALALVTDPQVIGDGRPMAPVDSVVATGPAVVAKLEARGTVIRRRRPADFDGRGGYDPGFLGIEVPLPVVPAFLDADMARLLGSDETELRYTHYSAVMSRSRRLAIFTAVNVNGPLIAELDRKDRDPDRAGVAPEAAADVWYFDPRIDEACQIPAEIYDRTRFDFGHLTRRLDPVWGDARTTRIANDDTFFLTNCTPQHESLNRKTWLRLEDAVLNFARSGRQVSVLTGPVLDPRDPEILGVQVPTAYWKIAVWTENGSLMAMGFVQDQGDLVDAEARRFEAVPTLRNVQLWRTPIREIGRLTGLDFGPLPAADRPMPRGRNNERLDEAEAGRIFDSAH